MSDPQGEFVQMGYIEEHDMPGTRSDERMHDLDIDCWCRPEVVRVVRNTHGILQERRVVHRRAVIEQVPA